MRKLIFAAALLTAGPAMAQVQQMPPASPAPLEQAAAEFNQDWMAADLAHEHVRKSLMAYITEANKLKAEASEAKDAEARLKWVLDNWVSKGEVSSK